MRWLLLTVLVLLVVLVLVCIARMRSYRIYDVSVNYD